MNKEYLRKIRRFSKAFITDVIETTIRIHEKDGKAYPLRVHRSVSKRWSPCHRNKITMLLNHLTELGMFEVRFEPVEEYRERMQKFTGLYERGCRRKYFSPSDGIPKGSIASEYRKITHQELGIEDDPDKEEEYPV